MTSKVAAQCEPVALALVKRLGTFLNSDFTAVVFRAKYSEKKNRKSMTD